MPDLTGPASAPAWIDARGPDTILPEGYRFPDFLLLAFAKPR